MYISFVASPLMKYAFFASLDEINGIFIPKLWISSMSWFCDLCHFKSCTHLNACCTLINSCIMCSSSFVWVPVSRFNNWRTLVEILDCKIYSSPRAMASSKLLSVLRRRLCYCFFNVSCCSQFVKDFCAGSFFYYLSRVMWFSTMWHFDMNRLRRTCAASL